MPSIHHCQDWITCQAYYSNLSRPLEYYAQQCLQLLLPLYEAKAPTMHLDGKNVSLKRVLEFRPEDFDKKYGFRTHDSWDRGIHHSVGAVFVLPEFLHEGADGRSRDSYPAIVSAGCSARDFVKAYGSTKTRQALCNWFKNVCNEPSFMHGFVDVSPTYKFCQGGRLLPPGRGWITLGFGDLDAMVEQHIWELCQGEGTSTLRGCFAGTVLSEKYVNSTSKSYSYSRLINDFKDYVESNQLLGIGFDRVFDNITDDVVLMWYARDIKLLMQLAYPRSASLSACLQLATWLRRRFRHMQLLAE